MERNSLEDFVVVIGIIAKNRPLDLAELSSQAKMEKSKATSCLDFLSKKGLIKEYNSGNVITFAATVESYKILCFFNVSTTKVKFKRAKFTDSYAFKLLILRVELIESRNVAGNYCWSLSA
jgi:predicted transcriptional regulator